MAFEITSRSEKAIQSLAEARAQLIDRLIEKYPGRYIDGVPVMLEETTGLARQLNSVEEAIRNLDKWEA